jgi:hypothetical protein
VEARIAELLYRLVNRVDNLGIGVQLPVRAEDFSISIMSRLALVPTQPPTQWVLGTLSWGWWQGPEADHLPAAGAEVKITGAIPPLPKVFMAWCLINYGQG